MSTLPDKNSELDDMVDAVYHPFIGDKQVVKPKTIEEFVVGVWESEHLGDPHITDPVAATWNTAYPERHLWKDIGPEAQEEWRRVFSIYDQIKSSSTQP